MRAALFLNGNPPSRAILESIDQERFVACADGAYDYLKELCAIDLLVGDFDSVLNRNVHAKKIIELSTKKDITDGHFALNELLALGAKDIDIYGALGGRIDHEYCNLSLLSIAADFGAKARIVDNNCDIYLIKDKLSLSISKGSVVSLAPFSEQVHILLSRGLAYGIFDEVFCKTTSKGISNIAVNEDVYIELASGKLLCFIQKE